MAKITATLNATGLLLGLGAGVMIAAPAAASPEPGSWVGVAGAIKGDVQLTPLARAESHRPQSGERLFLGDRVVSGKASHLQILLRDKTTFTLGEDCDLIIDRFVYDPAATTGEIRASVTKGAFRFVTGEIPHRDPDAFTIAIPAGTIGVRGTIGEVVVGLEAIAAARASGLDVSAAVPELAVLVVLRGPGNDLNTGERIGRVVVNAAGGTVTLLRPNWASFIGGPAAAPSPAFEIAPSITTALAGALLPSDRAAPSQREAAAEDDNGSRSVSDREPGSLAAAAGQDTALGGVLSSLQQQAEERQSEGAIVTLRDATDTPFADGPMRPLDFLTRQGTANYSSTGVPLSDGGSYSYSSTVSFDTRNWTTTASFSSPSTFDGNINAVGEADLSGNVIARTTTQNFGPGLDATLTEQIVNQDGTIAAAIQHSLTIETAAPAFVTGSGVAQ